MVTGGTDGGKDGMPGNVFGALMAMMLASRSGVAEVEPPAVPSVHSLK
jgi:hypothetical protein